MFSTRLLEGDTEVGHPGGSGKDTGVEGEVRVDPAAETQPRGILTFHLQD